MVVWRNFGIRGRLRCAYRRHEAICEFDPHHDHHRPSQEIPDTSTFWKYLELVDPSPRGQIGKVVRLKSGNIAGSIPAEGTSQLRPSTLVENAPALKTRGSWVRIPPWVPLLDVMIDALVGKFW